MHIKWRDTELHNYRSVMTGVCVSGLTSRPLHWFYIRGIGTSQTRLFSSSFAVSTSRHMKTLWMQELWCASSPQRQLVTSSASRCEEPFSLVDPFSFSLALSFSASRLSVSMFSRTSSCTRGVVMAAAESPWHQCASVCLASRGWLRSSTCYRSCRCHPSLRGGASLVSLFGPPLDCSFFESALSRPHIEHAAACSLLCLLSTRHRRDAVHTATHAMFSYLLLGNFTAPAASRLPTLLSNSVRSFVGRSRRTIPSLYIPVLCHVLYWYTSNAPFSPAHAPHHRGYACPFVNQTPGSIQLLARRRRRRSGSRSTRRASVARGVILFVEAAVLFGRRGKRPTTPTAACAATTFVHVGSTLRGPKEAGRSGRWWPGGQRACTSTGIDLWLRTAAAAAATAAAAGKPRYPQGLRFSSLASKAGPSEGTARAQPTRRISGRTGETRYLRRGTRRSSPAEERGRCLRRVEGPRPPLSCVAPGWDSRHRRRRRQQQKNRRRPHEPKRRRKPRPRLDDDEQARFPRYHRAGEGQPSRCISAVGHSATRSRGGGGSGDGSSKDGSSKEGSSGGFHLDDTGERPARRAARTAKASRWRRLAGQGQRQRWQRR